MYPAKVSFLNKQLAYFKGKFLLKRNLLLLGKKIPNVRNRPINPFIRASEHAGFKKKKKDTSSRHSGLSEETNCKMNT